MPYWHYGSAAGWVGPLVMIVVAVAILAAIGVAIALLARRSSGPPQADAALDILRRRFASGEIDQEEFDRRREALRH
ncbi:MAG TPA: SHOCT domain-containing protein [Amycolatopsis sp.]|nr:SHOCT domain-containing protein [Amycolatopsis sp.]